MTFQQVLEQFGFERNTIDWSEEWRVSANGKYYYVFLNIEEDDSVKWQGQLVYSPEELMEILTKWRVEIVMES